MLCWDESSDTLKEKHNYNYLINSNVWIKMIKYRTGVFRRKDYNELVKKRKNLKGVFL